MQQLRISRIFNCFIYLHLQTSIWKHKSQFHFCNGKRFTLWNVRFYQKTDSEINLVTLEVLHFSHNLSSAAWKRYSETKMEIFQNPSTDKQWGYVNTATGRHYETAFSTQVCTGKLRSQSTNITYSYLFSPWLQSELLGMFLLKKQLSF